MQEHTGWVGKLFILVFLLTNYGIISLRSPVNVPGAHPVETTHRERTDTSNRRLELEAPPPGEWRHSGPVCHLNAHPPPHKTRCPTGDPNKLYAPWIYCPNAGHSCLDLRSQTERSQNCTAMTRRGPRALKGQGSGCSRVLLPSQQEGMKFQVQEFSKGHYY